MIYDVGIVGCGISGSFAAFKLSKEYKNVKAIIFDIGRPPAKRRRQIEGFLGCLPNSDGKLYQNDIDKVSELTGLRKAKSANTYFNNVLSNINNFKVIKDRAPSISTAKKIKKLGYDLFLNDYIQIYPKDIHSLSKYMADYIENNPNLTLNFDNEVKKITKQKGVFVVSTDNQEYRCKKLILSVGRSGWRWAGELFNDLGIIDNNDISKFGIRIEMNAGILKDFNKSNCTIIKNNEWELGPFSWNGTVIPEDHLDLAISAFRANENRWKTDKVSFSLIGNRNFPKQGFNQTDRIGKLTFILSNDRIIREKISYLLNNKSKISIIPEYDWLKDTINEINNFIPELSSKGYFHVPTIFPCAPKINLGTNLESEVSGMFVTGESAGIHGILAAALMGQIAIDSICK